MSRIDELKKQYKEFALCDLDIMKMAVPNQANKYAEMLAKLTKNYINVRLNETYGGQLRKEYIEGLVHYGIDYNYLETFDTETLYIMYSRLDSFVGRDRMELLNKFAKFNERKLIDNNDVTSYSSWNEVESAVALAEMKLIDKELEKQIVKVYEDDTWLSLKPLSLEASMKYGANTKWCTTTNTGQYYARYSDRGILIYNINKKTGYKVACFKNLHPEYDVEFSWWDVTDRRIDALESELSTEVLIAVRKNITDMPCYNSALMSEEEQDKLQMYKEGNYRFGEELPDNQRLIISGGFGTTTGTTTTYTYNPNTFSTTGTTLTIGTNGNVGIGTTTPNAFSVTGNIEVTDGDIVFRTNGEERARYTSDGLRVSRTQEALNEDLERRLFADITREMNGGDRIAADAQQRLDDAMAEQMAEVTERAIEKRAANQTILDQIELGTLEEGIISKMQQLAGIDTTETRLRKIEAARERLLDLKRIENEQEADQVRQEQEINMAEQPVLPSKPKLNIWEQIKKQINRL